MPLLLRFPMKIRTRSQIDPPETLHSGDTERIRLMPGQPNPSQRVWRRRIAGCSQSPVLSCVPTPSSVRPVGQSEPAHPGRIQHTCWVDAGLTPPSAASHSGTEPLPSHGPPRHHRTPLFRPAGRKETAS